MEYYVYQLIDPRTDEVFYIGKGCKKRMYRHVENVERGRIPNGSNKKLSNKIKKILYFRLKIKYKKVFVTKNEQKAYDKEQELIQKIGLENLCNLVEGGSKGRLPWNKGKKGLQVAWNKGKTGIYSEETKRKMREAKIGHIPWNKEKPCSEDTKKKISKSLEGNIPWNKGLTVKDDSRIGKPWLGKSRSEETRKKISNSLKKRVNK